MAADSRHLWRSFLARTAGPSPFTHKVSVDKRPVPPTALWPKQHGSHSCSSSNVNPMSPSRIEDILSHDMDVNKFTEPAPYRGRHQYGLQQSRRRQRVHRGLTDA